MSTTAPQTDDAGFIVPTFAALMRIASLDVRGRMLKAIHEAGFTAFQEQHFAVFAFPLPAGIRPADLARQNHISRQALNYLVTQLEDADYVMRRTPAGETRRLIYLTPKGHQVTEVMFTCLRALEKDWSDRVGEKRFAIFVDVLRDMTADRMAL